MSENELEAYRSINNQLVQENIKLRNDRFALEEEKNHLWASILGLRSEL
jgi:hypothetical protein